MGAQANAKNMPQVAAAGCSSPEKALPTNSPSPMPMQIVSETSDLAYRNIAAQRRMIQRYYHAEKSKNYTGKSAKKPEPTP